MKRAVLVLGGGPAGLVAAIGLATRGWPVTVLTVPARPRIEGLSARVAEGLRVAGCEYALSVLGTPVPRHAHWNGEAFTANTEFVVERQALDAALAADAKRAGADVLQERVRSAAKSGEGWVVATSAARGEPRRHQAGFLIEARGRAARSSGKATRRGPETLALTGTWRAQADGAEGTIVASFRDGWAWCARQGGMASATILVAGGRGALPKNRQLGAVFWKALETLGTVVPWLGTAGAPDRIDVRDATPLLDPDCIGPDWLRLGDAALAIDPLSGHGIYEALRAALTVPAIVNTLVNRAEDAELAQAFHRGRLADACHRHARAGRDFYGREARWASAPFWAARRGGDEPAREVGTHIGLRPVLDHDWIVARKVLITPEYPLGARRIDEQENRPMIGGGVQWNW